MSELDKLLRRMEEAKATELYMMVGQAPKYRIDGDMVPVEDYSALDQRMLGRYLMELVNEDQRERFFTNRDLYFIYSIEGKYRYRCNYLFQHTGYAAVFRPIPLTAPTFAELNLPPAFQKLAELPAGMVLVAGPQGSGISTTLATIVDTINENLHRHILVLEDPLEFLHKDKKSIVTHREVRTHTESLSKAIQAIVRQDVDVAIVSELDGPETIFGALRAATAGTLVFGAVHAGSAAGAIDAVIGALAPDHRALARDMLAESLQAVVVQDLLFIESRQDRVPACEVLLRSDGLAEAIQEGNAESIVSLIESGRGEGMQTMDDALAELADEGVIDGANAYRKARDKERFAKYAPGDAAGSERSGG